MVEQRDWNQPDLLGSNPTRALGSCVTLGECLDIFKDMNNVQGLSMVPGTQRVLSQC